MRYRIECCAIHLGVVLAGFCIVYGASVDIGGRIEPRYELAATKPFVDSSSAVWAVNKAELSVEGSMGKNVLGSFELTVDAADAPVLHDAWAGLRFANRVSLRAGRMKPCFGYEFLRSSSKLETPERGAASKFVAYALADDSRQQGLLVRVDLPLSIGINAGVYDGPNYTLKGFEPFELAAAKLEVPILGLATVSGSVLSQVVWRELDGWYRWRNSVFWDCALIIEPFAFMRGELEYFGGDGGLGRVLPEIQGPGTFVENSVRGLVSGIVTVGRGVFRPGVQIERVNTGSGYRIDATPFLCFDGPGWLRCRAAATMAIDEDVQKLVTTDCIAQITLSFRTHLGDDDDKEKKVGKKENAGSSANRHSAADTTDPLESGKE